MSRVPGASTIKRGRPQKFGRPASLVAVTLPEDVLEGLSRIHSDLGWAIVALFEKRPASGRRRQLRPAPAQLTNVGARRALIVVNPDVLRRIEGVTVISLANGPAFIALAPGKGLADLELATTDRLETQRLRAHERHELELLRTSLRAWRRDPQLNVRTQSIIVIERKSRPERGGRTTASRSPETPSS